MKDKKFGNNCNDIPACFEVVNFRLGTFVETN